IKNRRVRHVRLRDEPRWRTHILLLTPVHRNLRLARFRTAFDRHRSRHPFRTTPRAATRPVAYDRPGVPSTLPVRRQARVLKGFGGERQPGVEARLNVRMAVSEACIRSQVTNFAFETTLASRPSKQTAELPCRLEQLELCSLTFIVCSKERDPFVAFL